MKETIVSVDYVLMRSVHGMLQQLTGIAGQLRKGPLQLNLARTNEANFETALAEAKETLQQTQLATKARELQLKEREAKVVDLKGRLNEADSNKEYQLIKDRIAADEQANSVLADEIFEMLEKIDVLEAEAKQATENLDQSKADTKKMEEKVKAEQESLQADQVRIKKELKEKAKGLHRDVAGHFNRLIKIKGEDSFAETNAETCGNCHMQLTAQTANELLMRNPVFCKGCDAIMYLSASHPRG